MMKLALVVVVVLASLIANASAEKPKIVMTEQLSKQLKAVQWLFTDGAKALNKHSFGDSSFECGLCAIAVNEVEGFLVENLTIYEMEEKLKNDVCANMGLQQFICDTIVDMLPTLLAAFDQKYPVGTACVEIHMCAKPPQGNHQDPVPAPLYTINLDLPPAQRWKTVCSVPQYGAYMQGFVNLVKGILPDNGKALEDAGDLLNEYYFPTEYAQEISGCGQYLGVSTGWLTIINIGYEISDACTSIVAQTLDGKIFHARNLDFWTGIWLTDTLRNMTFQAEFMKGGKLMFHATTFAGFVGVLSGQKPNAFSVTVDTRFYPGGVVQMFYEIIAAIQERNASLVTFLSRKVFTNENNFAAALENLSNDELIADVYYIIAGVSAGQGAVISRNRINATDVWMLDPPKRWFEVETNYDHWEQPPWFDDRVAPANNAMNAMGRQNLSLDGMMQVLTVKPVMNIQTTYTILSCPATSFYKSYARWCDYPCTE